MTQTPTHYVRPTSATSIPQNLIFVDVESRSRPDPEGGGVLQSFRLGVAISVQRFGDQWKRRDVLHFTTTFDFWEFVTSKATPKKPVWIFSHNLSCDAAWLGTWEQMEEQNLKLNVPCANCGEYQKGPCKDHHPFRGTAVITDPPVILCLRSRAGVIRMVDTMNYWKTSVYKLGQGVGYPKILILGSNPDDDVLFQLCEADATIIERTMCGLLDEWDHDQCGHFTATAAGLGWAAFRKTIAAKEILVCHDEPQISMQRAAYYGGQAEAFFVGAVREPVSLFDVRSLYPSVMRENRFPVEFLEMEENISPGECLRRLSFDCAVAHVVLRTERAGYPLRLRGGVKRVGLVPDVAVDGRLRIEPDRLGFPIGRYATHLAGPELLRAIARDECEEIISIAWFRSGRIFQNFVDIWFSKRPLHISPATFTKDLLCKTVLNSLSGYLAKHKIRWKERPDLRPLYRWGEWLGIQAQTDKITKYRSVGGAVQELEEPGESRDSFPAISAYITAYGREQMLWLREQCPPETVYYQDTDSLVLNCEGENVLRGRKLIGTGELGRLRFMHTLPGLVIHAVKDYEFEGHRVIAGVREKATVEGPGRFRQERWESIADQWSRGGVTEIRVGEEVVAFSRTRIPRPIGPDGWTSAPRVDTKTENPF